MAILDWILKRFKAAETGSFFVGMWGKAVHILWVMCINLWKPLQIAEYSTYSCG